MAFLGMLLGREWMIKKIHDGLFKQIKKDKRKLKDDWCLVTIEQMRAFCFALEARWDKG